MNKASNQNTSKLKTVTIPKIYVEKLKSFNVLNFPFSVFDCNYLIFSSKL